LRVRGLHAFQIDLTNEAIRSICRTEESPLQVVDIGDSAGTHIQYLQELNRGKGFSYASVNVDTEAVRRIREKGLQAVHARAEEVADNGFNADVFVAFEVLEHLPNPIQFLKSLSYRTSCQALVLTVPYVRQSRVGLHHLRNGLSRPCNPENTHIFELCPDDWQLLFLHAGWSVRLERLYLQYPRHNLFRFMGVVWKALDFEGFWGAILTRDHTWSDLYRNEL
jgi:2-polyprenyl-3-methyl-5-hydroxy-6-metoxy-1,4-benzoquinol methylase